MARGHLYAGIDVGTTKICTLVGQMDANGALEVLGVGVAPSRGLAKGMVVNIDETVEAISASVERAERTSGTRIRVAHVGITGNHLTSLTNRGTITVTRGDRLVSEDDVSRVLEAAKTTVGIPSNREIVHVLPRTYTLDGQEGVRNPVGMHGFRLDVETQIITGAITSIQNLTKCVEQAGIAIESLVLEPLASAEAVLSDDERETGAVLVDIGGGTTDIAVFCEGSVGYTSVLPVGGYQFTHDLVIGLRTPFAAAEQAKIACGSVDPMSVAVDDTVELSVFGQGGSRQVPRRLMCEILDARAEELLALVRGSIQQSGYGALVPAGVVLTGGGARLTGLTNMAEKILGMPVRVGSPQGIIGLVDTIDNPAYATSVGLLLWAARYSNGAETSSDSGFTLAGFNVSEFLRSVLAMFRGKGE